jgi:hypothetical protein
VSQSIHRRSLTPDQRTAIVTQYRNWSEERATAAAKLIAAGRKYGVEGGRGQNNQPHIRQKIAWEADSTQYKAKQAIKVSERPHAGEGRDADLGSDPLEIASLCFL